MSLDEAAEQRLYNAIEAVMNVPRPRERKRIFLRAVKMIMCVMGWTGVTLEKPEDKR